VSASDHPPHSRRPRSCLGRDSGAPSRHHLRNISTRPFKVRRALLCTVVLSPGEDTDVSPHLVPYLGTREQSVENSNLANRDARSARERRRPMRSTPMAGLCRASSIECFACFSDGWTVLSRPAGDRHHRFAQRAP
jgi:hypothetical protein